MGSRKRERLFGTGSQTNAYTDFHHTVFYAACPISLPSTSSSSSSSQPMMPLALDALSEVMEARVESGRLEKERAAVLSEMTMVNTIEYRVECNILSTLHRENRLAKRFPIGKEELIKSWTCEDVREFHRTHYRPDNVLLYVVGDVNVRDTERVIREKFGKLSGSKHGGELTEEAQKRVSDLSEAVQSTVKAKQSWHYPPVSHEFVHPTTQHPTTQLDPKLEYHEKSPAGYDINLRDVSPRDDLTLNIYDDITFGPSEENQKRIRPHIYSHNLLQSFSLHLFTKKPVKPIVSLEDFKKSVARRICLAALQIRLNVNARGGDTPAFNFIEVNVVDSSREGCEISSVDLMSEYDTWEEAVSIAVREIKKLGKYSITKSEFLRYSSSLMSDSAQLASQGENIAHGDQLSYLMETVSNGHTFMSPMQAYEITNEAMESLTIEDVDEVAKEVSERSEASRSEYLNSFWLTCQTNIIPLNSFVSHLPSSLGIMQLCEFVTSLADDDNALDGPLIAIACTPITKTKSANVCNPENLVEAIRTAANLPVEKEAEMEVSERSERADEEDENTSHNKKLTYSIPRNRSAQVPQSLTTAEDLQLAEKLCPASWVPGSFTDGTPDTPKDKITAPMTLRRLSNGLRVGAATTTAESQRGHLKIIAPGGRMAEKQVSERNTASES